MATPFITDAEATQKIQQSYNQLENQIDGISGGYRGAISIADTPTEDGIYSPTEAGTYTNAGGLIYAPEGVDEGFDVKFIKTGANWVKNTVDVSSVQLDEVEMKRIYKHSDLVPEIIDGYYINESGNLITSNPYDVYVYELIGTHSYISLSSISNSGGVARAYGFYSSEDIESANVVSLSGTIDEVGTPVFVEVPSGATHIAVSIYPGATITVGLSYLDGQPITNEIAEAVSDLKSTIDDELFTLSKKLSENIILEQLNILTQTNITPNGDLNMSTATLRSYVYDVEQYQGDNINLKQAGNLGNSMAYAFYNSDTDFNSSTAVYVRPGTFTDYDESMIVPAGSKRLLVVKYNTATVPYVSVDFVSERPILSIVDERISEAVGRNAISEGLSVVKIDEEGEVRLLTKLNDTKAIFIHFKKCMFNELYTYYNVQYVDYSDINPSDYTFTVSENVVTTGSDNIGPLNILGGAWTGGNHSYANDGVTKTAETLNVDIFTDGVKAPTSANTIICKSLQIKVKNMIYDPRVPPVGSDTILSTPLAEEYVFYNVEDGDINVSLSHNHLEDSIVSIYYGMQTVCTLDEVLTSGGDTLTFKARNLATSFLKSEYPKFNRWLQRNTAKTIYESVFLNTTFGMGDHSFMSGDISSSSGSKLYHVLMRAKDVFNGEVYSWNGTYSWKMPIAETADYIAFLYSVNGNSVLAVNIFNAYDGYVEVNRDLIRDVELIDATNGITLDSAEIEPLGVKVTALNAGFINIKII